MPSGAVPVDDPHSPVGGAKHRIERVAKRSAGVNRGVGRRAVDGGELDRADRDEREAADQRAFAEEARHKCRLRMREQLLRRRELLEHAALRQQRDAVAKLDRLIDVVGHEDDRLAHHPLEAEQLVLKAVARDRVDGSEGLVHEQDVGIGAECPRHTDALPLAAAQLRRQAARVILGRQRDEVEQLLDPRLRALLRPAEQPRDGRDVVGDRLMREEPHLLNDIADRAAQVVDVVRARVAPVDAIVPPVGSMRRLIILSDVVLPHPDGPTRITVSPDLISSERWSTATWSPYRLTTLSKVITSPPPRRGRARGIAGCRRESHRRGCRWRRPG